MIVLMSGHGAIDHLHALREECDHLMKDASVRAITTCWNELTADVNGDIHDHGAKVEISYMLELRGDLVQLKTLADGPDAKVLRTQSSLHCQPELGSTAVLPGGLGTGRAS